MAILLILDVSAILLNGLIAYVLRKHKKTSIVTFWFIYCLSISDVMVGVSGLFFHSVLLKILLGSSSAFWVSLRKASAISIDYFLMTSGHLIFFTAIDRCIHMKYLNKYSMIMTKSKACWIIVFSVVFCILLVIPRLVASEEFIAQFYVGINAFHATAILLIYAIYIKIYISIKKHIAALPTVKDRYLHVQHQPDKKNAGQNATLKEQHCNRCLETKGNVGISSAAEHDRSKSCVLAKNVKALEPLEDAFVLSTKLVIKSEKTNDTKPTPASSKFLKNEITHAAGQENLDCVKSAATQEAAKKLMFDGKCIKKSLARKVTPEQDFRKATLLIFLALFVCYFPNFSHNFYFFATRDENDLFSFISRISVLLNSSLNAVILIFCSKEIQRNVKAIFAQILHASSNNRN